MSEEDVRRKAIAWAGRAGQVLQQAAGDPGAIAYARACAVLSSAYSALQPPLVTMTRRFGPSALLAEDPLAEGYLEHRPSCESALELAPLRPH